MKRTISLKLVLSHDEAEALLETQKAFSNACNQIVPFAVEGRCWNQVALHHLAYYQTRDRIKSLGSQMVCNAIRKVCAGYKTLKIKKTDKVPTIVFKESSSIHYCARTFSFKNGVFSLFSLKGRIRCHFVTGAHQEKYLAQGKVKEGELIRRGKTWFFNLVLELPDAESIVTGSVMGVDLGETNLAVTSNGTIYGGKKLRHERDKFLNRRRALQSNGSRAAKRCLRKISGKEARRAKEKNHLISKAIVKEAILCKANTIVLENLTHIRKRIRAKKRGRTCLHRWAFRQFQDFVEYKAEACGLRVVYTNPAYTSLICSCCGELGSRHKHLFKCLNCGSYQHSDRNAAINLSQSLRGLSEKNSETSCGLTESVVSVTASVNTPMVAAARLATSFCL